MTRLEDYDWLVANRSRIQEVMLDLHKLLRRRYVPALKSREPERSIAALMVGTAFSLWRAVFLSDADRTWAHILKRAECFLARVVHDNTINYSQDRESRDWSVGYYLNNAILRAVQYQQKLPRIATEKRLASIRAFSTLERIHKRGIAGRVPQKVWEAAYDSLSAALNLLKERLSDNQRRR